MSWISPDAKYQTYYSNINFFKQQQWNATYYVLLLYGALVGIDFILMEEILSSSVDEKKRILR